MGVGKDGSFKGDAFGKKGAPPSAFQPVDAWGDPHAGKGGAPMSSKGAIASASSKVGAHSKARCKKFDIVSATGDRECGR